MTMYGPSPESIYAIRDAVAENGQRLDQLQASLQASLQELNSMLIAINNNLLMLTTFWMLEKTEGKEEEAKEFQPTGNMTPSELIEQMKEDAKEKLPALADVEKIKEMKAAMVTMANVLANVR